MELKVLLKRYGRLLLRTRLREAAPRKMNAEPSQSLTSIDVDGDYQTDNQEWEKEKEQLKQLKRQMRLREAAEPFFEAKAELAGLDGNSATLSTSALFWDEAQSP